MARSSKRSTRLIELAEYLTAKQRPRTIQELAAHFEVHRSTIYRMLEEIESELCMPVQRRSDGAVWIEPDDVHFSVRLTLNEAMAVFLAARLLARYADKPNPHAVKALRALSHALRKIAPRIAQHIERTSERLERPLNDAAKDYLHILEQLTRAWAEGRRVLLYYRDEPDTARPFDIYFIEPSAVGYRTYVIGYDHHRQDERTFALERIVRVTSTLDTYEIPSTFDPLTKLAGAWGVNWGKGKPPTPVVLRFRAGRATRRLRESNWHETQVIEDLPDGGCLLRIVVGDTTEMKPWIRQWGPDCEVLEPESLRREIAEEMRQAARLYEPTHDERKEQA